MSTRAEAAVRCRCAADSITGTRLLRELNDAILRHHLSGFLGGLVVIAKVWRGRRLGFTSTADSAIPRTRARIRHYSHRLQRMAEASADIEISEPEDKLMATVERLGGSWVIVRAEDSSLAAKAAILRQRKRVQIAYFGPAIDAAPQYGLAKQFLASQDAEAYLTELGKEID